MHTIPRQLWLRALMTHPPGRLMAVTDHLAQQFTVTHKTLPQAGLCLLQMCDGVYHEPYFLGELPLASAWVMLTLPDGRSYEGAAQVMADTSELATALAICDAVMAHRLMGWETVAALIDDGMQQIHHETAVRQAILAKTQVRFSTLSTLDDDDDDDG